MGRPRKHNLDLPPRLYLKGLTYYYAAVTGPWPNLGKDREVALHKWVELECAPMSVTVANLVNRWVEDIMMVDRDKVRAHNTKRQYKLYAKTIEAKFGAIPCDELSPFMLARWRDIGTVKKIWFNGCMAVLRNAYQRGGEWGWAKTNPALAVTLNQVQGSDRLVSDDEFRAMRDHKTTERWMALAMDISYLSTLRESDVLALRWDAVNEALNIRQIKTDAKQRLIISPALRAVLESVKRLPLCALSPFVVCTDKGRPIKERRLQRAFAEARKAAGIKVYCRFHDIRAMAITEADAQGLDAQAMAGHTTKKQTDAYIKRRKTTVAPTLAKRL